MSKSSKVSSVQTLNAITQTLRNDNAKIPALPKGEAATRDRLDARAYVSVEVFHKALIKECFAFEVEADRHERARAAHAMRMNTLIRAQYGDKGPDYAQAKTDRLALEAEALIKGYVNGQVFRKAYNEALIAAYGALPVSMAPSAIANRKAAEAAGRGSNAKKGKVLAKPARAANVTAPTMPESIGQVIARCGVYEVIAECARILATSKDTSLDAKTLMVIAQHYAKAA